MYKIGFYKAKEFAVQHSGKIVAGTAAGTALVGSASAMDAGSIANGTALFAAGVGVAQTEPLGSIISLFAVGIAALFFIYMVKKLR